MYSESEEKITSNEHMRFNKDLTKDFPIQIARIERVLDETIEKLKLLAHIPMLLNNNGEVLKDFLKPQDVEFITSVCSEGFSRSNSTVSERSSMSSALTNLNMFKKNPANNIAVKKLNRLGTPEENYETHVAYVVEIISSNGPLMKYLENLGNPEDTSESVSLMFINLMTELKHIMMDKFKVTALEEINYENDLKNAYRSNNLLSENVRDIEDQLDKQRMELQADYESKYDTMTELMKNLEDLKEATKNEVTQIILDSETLMMKDYLKSTELQETLAVDAKVSTQQYEALLHDHLEEEKSLRAKRFKVEAQLASWIAKYDQDIGDKQAELEKIQKEYDDEQDRYSKLKDEFDEQEDLYIELMREKEEEEHRIFEERAWNYLINRSARIIQRAWREHKARKLARKRGRKGKKSADKKKKGKEKKKEEVLTLKGGPDPNAIIDSKFGGDIMAELKDAGGDPFAKKDVTVDLTAD